MSDVLICPACRGPALSASAACPHCGAVLSSTRRGGRVALHLRQLALAASASMTLTACYGAPVPPGEWEPPPGTAGTGGSLYPRCEQLSESLRTPDLDGDRHCGIFDCDEEDPSVHANAVDVPGDGVDQDCRGGDATLPPDAGQ